MLKAKHKNWRAVSGRKMGLDLGPSLHERHWGVGEGLVKVLEHRSYHVYLRQPGEKEALGDLIAL